MKMWTSADQTAHFVLADLDLHSLQKLPMLSSVKKELTLHHTILTLSTQRNEALKIFKEKEEMLVTSIFSFSQNVFCPFRHKFQFLSHIYLVVCKSFEVGLV